MNGVDPVALQGLAAVLFCIGIGTVVMRRNVFFMLMGIELLLNAVNLSFVGFSQTLPPAAGMVGLVAPLFVIAIAAAEACVGLAMVISLVRNRDTLDADAFASMGE